jgi:hypothetical protein
MLLLSAACIAAFTRAGVTLPIIGFLKCRRTLAFKCGRPSAPENRDPARDWSYPVDATPVISALLGSLSAPIGTLLFSGFSTSNQGVTRAGAGSRFGADSQLKLSVEGLPVGADAGIAGSSAPFLPSTLRRLTAALGRRH